MGTLNTGMFHANFNPSELNTRSFAGAMLTLFPNGSAPLYYLMNQTGRTRATSTTHGYFTRTWKFSTTAINNVAGYTDADTTLTIDATNGLIAGMLMRNKRTGEVMRITTVNSTTSIDVTRAFGRVTAAAINDDDVLYQIGTAFEQGSNRPAARSLARTYVPNYTQIFRNAWALTDTARASLREQGISNIAENRQDCSAFHSVDIESAILYGQPLMDTSGTTPIHATQGVRDSIEQYAPSHVNAAGATTNYSELVELVLPAYEYSTDANNPNDRVGLVDQTAMKVIQDIGRLSGQIQMTTGETTFGMHYTAFKFWKGTIYLIEHPLMNALDNTAGDMVVVDLAALKLAYMDGRDAKVEEYGIDGKAKQVGDSGIDAAGGSLTSELAVENINPNAMAIVTGLTAGAA